MRLDILDQAISNWASVFWGDHPEKIGILFSCNFEELVKEYHAELRVTYPSVMVELLEQDELDGAEYMAIKVSFADDSEELMFILTWCE